MFRFRFFFLLLVQFASETDASSAWLRQIRFWPVKCIRQQRNQISEIIAHAARPKFIAFKWLRSDRQIVSNNCALAFTQRTFNLACDIYLADKCAIENVLFGEREKMLAVVACRRKFISFVLELCVVNLI